MAIVRLPYEYVPLPVVGTLATGLDREGNALGQFEVKKVTSGGKKNMTYTISLVVPKALAMDVRGVSVV